MPKAVISVNKEMNEFQREKAKHDALKFAINDILDNQYTQSGYEEKEALKCVINYAEQRLIDLAHSEE